MPKIIAYTYDAAFHCPACTRKACEGRLTRPFDPGEDLVERDEHQIPTRLTDREGNPVRPVFSTDELDETGVYCDTCLKEVAEPRGQWVDDERGNTVFLPEQCIRECGAPGRVDESVKYWVRRLDWYRCTDKAIRAELKEYGSWTAEQLADAEANRGRWLWIRCCDVREWRRLSGESKRILEDNT